MAVKAAIAAAIAWQIGLAVPSPADSYPYYAPLGAVIVIYPSVARSLRESMQAMSAIALGTALALLANWAAEPNAVTIALVVAAGVALGGIGWLGMSRSWVPIAAMFVLILGFGDVMGYVAGYVGQTLIGASVGLAVNAVFPPLPLSAFSRDLDQAAGRLAEQLREVAEALREGGGRAAPDADRENVDLAGMAMRAFEDLERIDDSLRGNIRARRYRIEVDRERRRALTLNRTALVVQGLIGLLRAVDISASGGLSLREHHRLLAAGGAEALAEAIEQADGMVPDDGQLARIDTTIEALGAAMPDGGSLSDPANATGAALLTELRHCRAVLATGGLDEAT